jgi:hypothetical protein
MDQTRPNRAPATVLVQITGDDSPSPGELVELASGELVRFGRGAPGVPVDLVLSDPCVPRLAGEVAAVDDHWTLSNFSADATYVVENPEGAGEHIKVPPARLAAPVPFEIARVVLPGVAGFTGFSVFAPTHAYLDRRLTRADTGDQTLSAFHLDETAKYFLVLVALCEPRLRDQSHVAIPTIEQLVQRLRPLPAFHDVTAAAVTFHIDYLARTKLRVKSDADPGERLGTKRAALVSLALRFNLVREDHLRMLPARLLRATVR